MHEGPAYTAETNGILIRVRPSYLAGQSDPDEGRWVWAYQIEIVNLTGEVVYSGDVSCGGDCNAYLMELNKQLVPGVYLVNLKTNSSRISRRLLVK